MRGGRLRGVGYPLAKGILTEGPELLSLESRACRINPCLASGTRLAHSSLLFPQRWEQLALPQLQTARLMLKTSFSFGSLEFWSLLGVGVRMWPGPSEHPGCWVCNKSPWQTTLFLQLSCWVSDLCAVRLRWEKTLESSFLVSSLLYCMIQELGSGGFKLIP